MGEGGIQSALASTRSSSMDGGGIHTGRAGMTENNGIQLCGNEASYLLNFRGLELENLTDLGGIDVAKMHVIEMTVIGYNGRFYFGTAIPCKFCIG